MLRAVKSLRFEHGINISLDGSVSVIHEEALPTRADGSRYRWGAISAQINKGGASGGKIQWRVDREATAANVVKGVHGLALKGQTAPIVVNLSNATHIHFLVHAGDTAEVVVGFLDWS